jgi:hypothetical protein
MSHSISISLPFFESYSTHFMMNAVSDQAYSTLEAAPGGHRSYRQEKPLPSDAGKQVVPDYGKQQVVYNGI